MSRLTYAVLTAAVLAGILGLVQAADPEKRVGPDGKQWDRIVDHALAYLKASQAADGSWSREKSPGVTGVVLTGMLATGRLSPDDPRA